MALQTVSALSGVRFENHRCQIVPGLNGKIIRSRVRERERERERKRERERGSHLHIVEEQKFSSTCVFVIFSITGFFLKQE